MGGGLMATSKRSKADAGRTRKVDAMTDQDAADYYYTHRNEPGDTATPVDLEAPRRLSRVVSVRFDPDEAAIIEQRAKEGGLTMSAFVRQAALGRPASPLTDVATVERLLELLTQALRKAQLSRLLNTVADDVAHIRGKIGA
jgi:hypothetical protein